MSKDVRAHDWVIADALAGLSTLRVLAKPPPRGRSGGEFLAEESLIQGSRPLKLILVSG